MLLEKKKHFYSGKGTNHKEDITIISTYVLSNRTYKMHELKTDINKGIDGQLNSSWRNFNTPLWITESKTQHKINKETEDLNNTMNEVDLIHNYKTLTQQQKETFLNTYGTFSNIDHILGHKARLTKCKVLFITKLRWHKSWKMCSLTTVKRH